MKQDWSRVSPEAKTRKILNKKSKRDILREKEIEELGGEPIEVPYGVPLTEEKRAERMHLWSTLFYNKKYPQRFETKKKKKRRYKKPSELSMKEYFKYTFCNRRKNAQKRCTEFEISIDDLEFPENCPVLGIPLTWGGKLCNDTATIDRVDPNKGYIPGNVVVMSLKANRIKNNATAEELQKVADWLKEQESKL